MKIVKTIKTLRQEILKTKSKGMILGFVPTMGALHEGHLSLIRAARKENDFVVVSIFVNPAQFGAGEDLNKYPRPRAKDLSSCRKERVDLLFCPDYKEMYPEGFSTYVTVEGLSQEMCGRLRPGHFRGVTTIVAKFFNLVAPDVVYFGQKDAQQAIIIKRMAQDLNFPLKIKVMPIVRSENGLALSSRNAYLDARQAQAALVLYDSLHLAEGLIRAGKRHSSGIISSMRKLISAQKGTRIDYIAVVDQEKLIEQKKITNNCLIALAVRVGNTRLIDNLIVKLK